MLKDIPRMFYQSGDFGGQSMHLKFGYSRVMRFSIIIHQYEIIANCIRIRSNNRDQNFITVAYTSHRPVSDDIKVCTTLIANASLPKASQSLHRIDHDQQ
jgi:hypothetical protein